MAIATNYRRQQLRLARSTPYGQLVSAGVRAGRLAFPWVASGATAAAAAYKASGKKSAIDAGVISTQRDFATRYVRKRMPRRRRKRWVRFGKRVQHVIMQTQPLQTYTVDYAGAVKSFAVNLQTTDGQMLGGVSPSNNDELLQVFKAVYGSALTISTIDKYKIFLKSMCLDVQLKNTGTSTVIVDVYTLLCRKSDKDSNRIDVSYTNAFAEQSAGSGGTVSATNPSTTVFQNPLFCSMWKILGKKEMLLGAGQTSTLQMRIPYNRWLNGKLLENNLQAIPGLTRAYLFQMRGAPENNVGTARLAAGEVTWMCQCTVAFGVPPSSTTGATTSNA